MSKDLIYWWVTDEERKQQVAPETPLPVTGEVTLPPDTIVNLPSDQKVNPTGNYNGGGRQTANFTVTTTGVELSIGPGQLIGRHSITIINDASCTLAFSGDPDFTYGEGLKLYSGQLLTLIFDPEIYVPIYAKTHFYSTTIGLTEGKNPS